MTSIAPLKRAAFVVAGQSPASVDVSDFDGSELPFLQGNAEFGENHPQPRLQCAAAPKRAETGDVLLSVRAPVGALNIADRPYGIGRGLCAIRPKPVLDSSFAWWAIVATAPGLSAVATGSTYDAVTADDVGALSIPVPSVSVQRAIADYLDRETARIDMLIAAKQRMLELLEERLAIYTRQLLMSVHHVALPLKRTWRLVDCKHHTPQYHDEGYPVISPGDTTPGRLDLSRAHRFVDEDDWRDLTADGRRPRKGDIVYSRNASIGIAAYVDTDAPFCMGQDVCLITSDRANQLFLAYFLNSLGLDQLEEQKIGSTFSRVNVAQIREVIVPAPGPEDQQRIAAQLDEASLSHQKVVDCLRRQILLLQERRQALITVAVTDQLDIPEAA